MLQMANLHAAGTSKPLRKGRAAIIALTAGLLVGCGEISVDDIKGTDPRAVLSPAAISEHLSPEARTVVTSYERDLRTAASAHVAEFGELPTSFADIASVSNARDAAINLIADGLGEQVPFASRETLEQAANSFVGAAERQVLEGMRAQDAPNP